VQLLKVCVCVRKEVNLGAHNMDAEAAVCGVLCCAAKLGMQLFAPPVLVKPSLLPPSLCQSKTFWTEGQVDLQSQVIEITSLVRVV